MAKRKTGKTKKEQMNHMIKQSKVKQRKAAQSAQSVRSLSSSKQKDSETQPIAIILVILCTALTSTAQIFYKLGAGKLVTKSMPELLRTALFNPQLWAGLILYGLGAVILILALKKGELSILYPIIALSYVWVSLLSIKFLGEQMNLLKWLGIIVIIIGVSLIGIGSQQAQKNNSTQNSKQGHNTANAMARSTAARNNAVARKPKKKQEKKKQGKRGRK